MTQDEIYEMVRQSDLGFLLGDSWMMHHEFVAFANLVAKHTLMNIDPSKFISCQEVMEAARMVEREACAKVCDDIDTEYQGEDVLATWCAKAIRARGEQA